MDKLASDIAVAKGVADKVMTLLDGIDQELDALDKGLKSANVLTSSVSDLRAKIAKMAPAYAEIIAKAGNK